MSARAERKSLPALALAWLLAGLFLAGCQTLERRIEQNAELFATFDPEVQLMIREGRIDLGFTPKMVEIAWGEPDLTQVRVTEGGRRDVWTYLNRHSVYAGRRFAGYAHEVFFDPRSNTHRSFMRPVYVSTYRTVETVRSRVEFEEGQVVSILSPEEPE